MQNLDKDELDAARAEEKRQQTEGTSFSNDVESLDLTEFAPDDTEKEVDAAFEQIQQPVQLSERDGTENVAADDFSELPDTDAEDIYARGYDKAAEEPEHYVDFVIPFDESPAKQPPETTTLARQHEGFMWYQMGMKDLGQRILEVLEDAVDEDGAAIMFSPRAHLDYNNELASPELSQFAADTKEWAEQQGDPLAGMPDVSTEEGVPEVPLMADASGDVDVAALNTYSTNQLIGLVCSNYHEAQALAKGLREANMALDNIDQLLKRDEYGGELWADISEWFNQQMNEAGLLWAGDETGMPLLDRIKRWVTFLNEYHGELPPMLKDLLADAPENDMDLTDGHKLAIMVTRLQRSDDILKRQQNIESQNNH